jgi:hypothetical protein
VVALCSPFFFNEIKTLSFTLEHWRRFWRQSWNDNFLLYTVRVVLGAVLTKFFAIVWLLRGHHYVFVVLLEWVKVLVVYLLLLVGMLGHGIRCLIWGHSLRCSKLIRSVLGRILWLLALTGFQLRLYLLKLILEFNFLHLGHLVEDLLFF